MNAINKKYIGLLKLFLYSTGAVLTILSLQSCAKNFEKYNTNPNNIDTSLLKNDNVNVGIYFPQMESNVIVKAAGTGDASAYQVCTNLNADLYSGYMGTATQGFQAQNGSYNFNNGWNNSAFTVAYNNIAPAWLQIKSLCETQHPDLYALANIIKVAGFHRITDIFGPIPYSKVGTGGFSVGFDAQQDIYNAFFAELDSAIATLSSYVQQYPGAKPAARFDLIYGGDYKEWIKFANSLKLRLALHIAYADPSLAQKEAEAAVSNSFGVMTTNADNAALASSSTLGIQIVNPVWVITGNYTDINAGAVVISFLNGYKDPRLASYVTSSTTYPGVYVGVRNGIVVAANKDRVGYSAVNFGEFQPISWMNAAEVSFLRAEGVLRGWNMGTGTAQSFYENGIQLSFQQWGVSGFSSYVADDTSTAQPYVDFVTSSHVNDVPAGTSYLSTITIQWNDVDSFEKKLERVITQKYLAMFGNGQEAWTEFRRTGYPKIWPVVVNNSNNTIPTALGVRRLPYPQQQSQSNPTGVAQGISELGGLDNGGTKLWWDKNPNH